MINDVSDESKSNVTGMHDVLNQVLQELKETKEKLENNSLELENTKQEMRSRIEILEQSKLQLDLPVCLLATRVI